MKKSFLAGVLASAVLVVSSPAFAQTRPAPAPAPASGVPQPRILVIDRNVILRLSAAGKDMLAQTQKYSQSAEAEFKAEEARLRSEAAGFQRQAAILSAEARAQKEREFNAKQQAFQKKVQDRQVMIQGGFSKAGRALDEALGPILQAIMKERGANLLLDRNSVVLATVDVDVTATAIERLDKKLPRVKVDLVRPPAQAAARPAATTP